MALAALHLQLAPILAAEKSKTAFYIVGGVLVVWALAVSLGLGMRRPNFPGSLQGQRIVMAISAVLVAGALATAVLTSGGSRAKGEGGAHPKQTSTEGAAEPGAPAVGPGSAGAGSTGAAGSTTTAASTAATTTTASTPTTTTTTATTTTTTTATTPAPAAGGHTLALAASPGGELKYDTTSLTAKAGKVTITMANMSPLEHNVTVAEGGKVLGATPTFVGGSRTLTLTLKPGKYVFYCSVVGHRQAGMEGTLTVSS